ncbi:MAG: hypothetical protein WA903_03960 [Ornithinimicrobium sp.]
MSTAQREAGVVDPAPRLPRRVPFLVTAALGLFIALGEIDRLIGMSPSSDGYTISVTDLTSPGLPFPLPDGTAYPWSALREVVAADSQVAGLLTAYLIIDLAFTVLLGMLLHRALRAACRIDCDPARGWLPLFATPTPWLAFVVMAAGITENVAIFLVAEVGSSGGTASAWMLATAATATSVKWVLIILSLIQIGHTMLASAAGRERIIRLARALSAQRYSLLAFLPIAALGLLPGSGILDQVPDVQRAWFGQDRRDVVGALTAALLLVLVSLGLIVLGRLISYGVYRRVDVVMDARYPGSVPQRKAPPLWMWLYGPGLIGVGLLWSELTDVGAVRWLPLGLFAAVPLAIVILSWYVRWHDLPLQAPELRRYDERSFRAVVMTGDVVALSGLVVGGLVLIRSHTAFLALGEGTAFQRVLPVVGFLGALAIWWLAPPLLARATGGSTVGPLGLLQGMLDDPEEAAKTAPGDVPRWVRRTAVVLVLASTAGFLALALWPVAVTGVIGVVASVLLALALIALLVGSTVVLHLHYAPPEIFWWGPLRLREAPVATLLILTVAGILVLGSDQSVHGIRGLRPPPVAGESLAGMSPKQRGMDQLFEEWDASTRDCVGVSTGGARPRTIRPMIMVAAEGGGIRAAYWTAAALDQIHDQTGPVTRCGLDSVILASGVSGGAVGLTVSRFVDPPSTTATGRSAADAVWALGSPDALAQGTVGLLVRDPIYSVTGLAVGSDVPAELQRGWVDRAGLMETTWEAQVPELVGDFFAPPVRSQGELSAALVLNSTATSTGCRVLVSHIRQGDARVDDCAGPRAPAAFSVDFAASFMARQPGEDDHCVERLNASTAAMLAARFPYVTPSGVVGPCGGAPQVQLIDGGYAEGSGVGSLVDLSAPLLTRVREFNEADTGAFIVPVLVYLDNGRGSDLVQPPPEAVAEVLVPPVGAMMGGSSQKSTAAWLQRGAAMIAPDSVGIPQDPSVRSALRPWGSGVFVVNQRSKPAIEAPLGWVLSDASRADMDSSLADDSASACDDETGQDAIETDKEAEIVEYGRLGDLIEAITGC